MPADPGPLDRGAAAGAGFVQTFGETLFEGGEDFGSGGHGVESGSKFVPVVTYWSLGVTCSVAQSGQISEIQ